MKHSAFTEHVAICIVYSNECTLSNECNVNYIHSCI